MEFNFYHYNTCFPIVQRFKCHAMKRASVKCITSINQPSWGLKPLLLSCQTIHSYTVSTVASIWTTYQEKVFASLQTQQAHNILQHIGKANNQALLCSLFSSDSEISWLGTHSKKYGEEFAQIAIRLRSSLDLVFVPWASWWNISGPIHTVSLALIKASHLTLDISYIPLHCPDEHTVEHYLTLSNEKMSALMGTGTSSVAEDSLLNWSVAIVKELQLVLKLSFTVQCG